MNKKHIIIDGHNDYASWSIENTVDGARYFLQSNNACPVSYEKFIKAHIKAGFFALWPGKDWQTGRKSVYPGGFRIELSSPIETSEAIIELECQYGILNSIVLNSEGKVSFVKNIDDLLSCIQGDLFGVILHMEGAEAINPDLSNLCEWYNRGLRSIGLTWARKNSFATGVPFIYPGDPDHGPGLSLQGFELVRKCNELGILIDVAHLNYKGFWDVLELSSKPVVSTHSGCHMLCSSSRNLMDEQIVAIKNKQGLIGVTFSLSELIGNINSFPKLEPVIDHIEHIYSLIGSEYIAIGSDFCGAIVPDELNNASNVTKLIHALYERGISSLEIENICHKNWRRVLSHVWK